MANPVKPVFDLGGTFVHLPDGLGATQVEGGTDFWARLPSRPELANGRMLWTAKQVRDTATWEMHPNGEELVYLLAGAVDLVLTENEVERTISLRPNNASIVPRGIWHRIVVQKPATLLFITPSAGTQQKPIEAKRQS
jgi:mannose-6-phosphate isomerase-like protein (cupin superfamily)